MALPPRLPAVFLAAALLFPAAARGAPERLRPPEPRAPGCRLLVEGSDELPSRACIYCHDGTGERPFCPGHKVGQPYPEPGDARLTLRTLAEVRRRGVNLPGGNVECVTCHDRSSPWERHLALPPGTAALRRIDHRDPTTYEHRPNWRLTLPNAPPRLPGQPVCPAMLCVTCHARADPP